LAELGLAAGGGFLCLCFEEGGLSCGGLLLGVAIQ
jgi:hypothetical protein